MKLSEHTVKVLKNFSQINQGILVHPGKELKTISTAQNIMATANVEEDFPQKFGIYDLNELLSTLSLFKSPVLTYQYNYVEIKEENGSSKSRYFFADESILTYPKKNINFPGSDVEVSLKQEDLQQILKASGVMGLGDIVLTSTDYGVIMKATDSQNSSSNDFDMVIDDDYSGEEFEARIKAENLKMMPGNYKLEISLSGITRFTDNNQGLVYYVALEKD